MITASIQMKGASIASIIEISYPFFVVLFTYLIFKESNLNTATIIGGILVFVVVWSLVGVVYAYRVRNTAMLPTFDGDDQDLDGNPIPDQQISAGGPPGGVAETS